MNSHTTMPRDPLPLTPLRLATLCLLLCGTGLLAGCGAEPPKSAAQPATLVNISPLKIREVTPKVAAIGTVRPVKTSVVASGASGVVESFLVQEGDFVEEGQVLSVLRMKSTNLDIEKERALIDERKHDYDMLLEGSRVEEIAEAAARMKSAQADFNAAQRRYRITQELYQKRSRSQDDLDEAKDALDAAQFTFESAQAAYERVKNGPRPAEIEIAKARWESQKKYVEFLESEREKRTTRAPFPGFVTAQHTEVGQFLSLGDPIVSLASMGEVDVIANVDQQDLKHVQLGDQATVRVRGSASIELQGTVISVIPRSEWESGSRGFPVKIRIPKNLSTASESGDAAPRPLLQEGMMAEVEFKGPPIVATMIPKDSLVRTSNGMMIYTFEPSPKPAADGGTTGLVKMVLVELGLGDQDEVQVVRTISLPGMPEVKLDANTRIVTEGAERLRPNQEVSLTPKASGGTEVSATDSETPGSGAE
jgi:HlyD family secretion protein